MGGKHRDKELMLLSARKYTSNPEELYLLERYFYLLVNTDFLKPAVYAFLINGKTYKQVSEEFNLKESYMRNFIYKNVRNVFDEISGDPLAFIRYKNDDMRRTDRENEIDRLTDRIDILIKKRDIRRHDGLLDYMLVDFSKYGEQCDNRDGKIDEEEYEEFIKRMQYISKPYLESLFNLVDENIFGYIVYLLTAGERRLSDRDKIKKKELMDLWLFPSE